MVTTKSLRILFAAVLALAWMPGTLRANDVVPAASAGFGKLSPRVLVLKGGKTICGDIGVTQNGYLVALGPNTGRMFITEQIVWFTATSVEDAYRELEKRSPDLSAGGHVTLANWCVEQGLYEQARSNLEQALRLEPENHSAMLLAEVLGKKLSRFRRLPQKQPGYEQAPEQRATPALTDEQLTRHFVSRIQPLLIHSCASAGCHGQGSQSTFQLIHIVVGRPVSHSVTKANRDAVEKLINVDDPKHSPLLSATGNTRHSAITPPLFPGLTGKRQWRMLSAWVEAMARAQRGRKPIDTSDSPASINIFQSGTGDINQASVSQPASPAHDQTLRQLQHRIRESTVKTADDTTNHLASQTDGNGTSVEAILEHAIKSGVPDAFDPDAFNRRFAPQTKLSITPPAPGSIQ